ncbi:MAG: thioredoxin domain-containing protein [Parachlamydiaceae bacterium]|nr:thioredoxin domain-containing protein [Parachlamydiaceae bacterium]
MTDRDTHTNRLINEKSPYLLQHSHNPVDWYPWGKEAFTAAREQDKPIFLSIGYATCHWCHVMEKESFENQEVANQMNETFICIKIDREELPEVDSLYMEFAQSMMAGAIGWPLNVILTPELEPFFAATYLPPHSKHGLMGLIDVIERITEVWSGEERESIIQQASHIVEAFADHVHLRGEDLPLKEQIDNTAELLFKMADPVFGGLKGMPKFPIGYQWNFLMRYSSASKESRAFFLVERTLDMMHRGGIYDHLGGGFSRYSVDEEWHVPHFEKMLYDNALLAFSYLEAWQVTKHPLYRSVSEEILNYILRDMTHAEGGFYSAEDSDSEGQEGLFYTWTADEIKHIMGANESSLFREFYCITSEGNFESRNILYSKVRLEEFATSKNMESQDLAKLFRAQRQLLWKVREQRVHPLKDDKILSSWNGLMIFSMAEAGAAFEEKRFTEAAKRAAQFIKKNLWQDGQLLRRWRDGEALYSAGLDEYAFLIRGILSLFESGQGTEWLDWAVEMTAIVKNQFKVDGGAFYQTDGRDPNIILRKCQFSDGAEPSGNAIHCENLLRLYQLTIDENYLQQAEDILKASKKFIDGYSPGYCYHMLNLLRYYDQQSITAVVALNSQEQHINELQQLFYHRFMSHRAIIWKKDNDPVLTRLIPFTEKQKAIDGKTTLYLCQHGICTKPMTDLSEIIEAIHGM